MHGMIATLRQTGEHSFRFALRHGIALRQRKAQHIIILLGIERAVVQRNAGTARGLLWHASTEALHHFRLAIAILVLQRDEESPIRYFVETEVLATPGVHIHRAIGAHRHVPRVTDVVGEDRGAEARRQRQPTTVALACGCWWCGSGFRLLLRAGGEREQHGKPHAASCNRCTMFHLTSPRPASFPWSRCSD